MLCLVALYGLVCVCGARFVLHVVVGVCVCVDCVVWVVCCVCDCCVL